MRKVLVSVMLIMQAMVQPVIAQNAISGFTEKSSADQKVLEQKFDAQNN